MGTALAPSTASRWRIPVILGITMFIHFLDRNNLAVALPEIAKEYGWDTQQLAGQGKILLAAFYFSLGISNMALSPFAERIGPKRGIMLAITAFSICTMLIAPLGHSFVALIIIRLLLGVGEGVHVPMNSTLVSRWFRQSERSRANAIWSQGILLATAFSPTIIIPMVLYMGWRPTFAVLGLAGLLIGLPLVWFFVEDAPSEAERPALEDQAAAGEQPSSYLRNPLFWLTVVGGSLSTFCAFSVLNWLPSYFYDSKGINFEDLGWPLTLVYGAGILGVFVMAWLGDLFNRRVLMASLGCLVASVLVFFAAQATSLVPLVALFALATFCQTGFQAQEFALVQRQLPADKVGAGSGLYNGLTILFGGVLGSLIPGSIAEVTGSFDMGILSVVVGGALAAAVWFILSRLVRY